MSPERKSSPERRPERFTLEEVTRLAREVALRDGYHVPTMIIEGNRGSFVAQIRDLPATYEEKAQLMFTTGFLTGRSGDVGQLREVFFISEAWFSVGDENTPAYKRPSEDPHRVEVLVISSLKMPEDRTSLILLEMVRNTEGQLTELRDLNPPEFEKGQPEIPLLNAFAEGFRRGIRARGH